MRKCKLMNTEWQYSLFLQMYYWYKYYYIHIYYGKEGGKPSIVPVCVNSQRAAANYDCKIKRREKKRVYRERIQLDNDLPASSSSSFSSYLFYITCTEDRRKQIYTSSPRATCYRFL